MVVGLLLMLTWIMVLILIWRSGHAEWYKRTPTSKKLKESIIQHSWWCQDFSPWHNRAGRTTALGSTQPPNRNEYQVCFLSSGMLLGVKAAGAYGWQPTTITVPLSQNLGALTLLDPSGPTWPVQGRLYLLPSSSTFEGSNSNNYNSNNNSHCSFKRDKCDQERSRKYLQNKDLPIATQHMWNVKTKVMPVITGATGTI